MAETGTSLVESKLYAFSQTFREEIIGAEEFRGDLCVVVRPGRIRDMVLFLKTDPTESFEMMMDLFGVDYQGFPAVTSDRYAVVYNLYSLRRKKRVRLKVFLPEERPEIDSICDLFKMANWFEREAWDMYGIVFKGHPNLTRILCHNEFEGHPLRKDYPSDKYQRLRSAISAVDI